MKKRKILKNYIIVLLMTISVFIVGILITKTVNNIKKNNLNSSPLAKIVRSVKVEDLNKIESKEFTAIFLSKTGDKYIYDLEKEMVKIVKNNKLKDIFFHIDLTKIEEKISLVNTKYNLTNPIEGLPAFIFLKDGNVTKVVASDKDNYITSGNIYQVLEIYELVK